VAYRVGLTGGIGAGKTTITTLFADHGVPVIDADVVARQVVEPGQPALAEIAEVFGAGILAADGRLDRAEIRRRIFQDQVLKAQLERILHPRIYAAMLQQADSVHAPYCILAVPLLLETGRRDFVQRLLVVDTTPELQVQRVTTRDQLTATEVNAIIRSQVSRGDRLAAADDIIVNDGDIKQLRNQVEALHQRYLRLAKTESAQR
jgi:dephospho-CoA kinase